MRPEECAYVGAMLDGEGCINMTPNGKYPSVRIFNTEVEYIAAILRATGCGRVHSELPRMRGKKRLWGWIAGRGNDLQSLIPQLLPYSTKAQALWKIIQ